MRISLLLAMAIGASFIGSNCGGSDVGDPCTPEDEYLTSFSGFSQNEVNIESRSFQCLTRVCLVNHFQGRVSCPYGQVEDPDAPNSGLATCMGTEEHRKSPECLPGGVLYEQSCQVPDRDGARWEDRIAVPVAPQFAERQADDTVYCSCRCDGAGDPKTFCECPSKYKCEPLVEDLGLGKGQLAGSYCVKDGTQWDPGDPAVEPCNPSIRPCDDDYSFERKNDEGETEKAARNQDSNACLPIGATCDKGQSCCKAPRRDDCRAQDEGGLERNCNGTCEGNLCKHGADPSTWEEIWVVETEKCTKDGTICN